LKVALHSLVGLRGEAVETPTPKVVEAREVCKTGSS